MNVECARAWEYLEHPVIFENPYLEAIENNMAVIRGRISKMDGYSVQAGGIEQRP